MEKPYFLISSTSGETQLLIDRRVQSDEETEAMRNRLLTIGCTQKELTQEERDELVQNGEWI